MLAASGQVFGARHLDIERRALDQLRPQAHAARWPAPHRSPRRRQALLPSAHGAAAQRRTPAASSARHSPWRSTVVTCSPSSRLTVSTMRAASTAPSELAAAWRATRRHRHRDRDRDRQRRHATPTASSKAPRSAALKQGRAASCTRIQSGSAAASKARASRPFVTESCRLAPPIVVAAWELLSFAAIARPVRIVRGKHNHDGVHPRFRQQRAQRPFQHGAHPSSGVYCLGRPEPSPMRRSAHRGPRPERSPRAPLAGTRSFRASGNGRRQRAARGRTSWRWLRLGKKFRCCRPCPVRCGLALRARSDPPSD